jgi:ADP-heptose:LPS heptosyltransferase
MEHIKKRKARALARRVCKRKLEGSVYAILQNLFLPLFRKQETSLNPDPKNILIIQCKQHIGDLVVAMPFIAALRDGHPQARLSVLVPDELIPMAKLDQNVDNVIGYARPLERTPWGALMLGRRLRRHNYDTVFLLSIHFFSSLAAFLSGAPTRIGYNYNGRGFLLSWALRPHISCNRSGWEYDSADQVPHIIEFWDKLLSRRHLSSLPPSWKGLDLVEQVHSVRAWMNHSLAGCNRPFIGMHTTARNPIRNWAPENFTQLCREISASYGGTIIFTGSDHDLQRIEGIRRNLSIKTVISVGQLDILHTWELIRQLDFMISVDTALIHLCAALRVPVISLFGPGDPLIWGPYGFADLVIQKHEACQRCKGGRCVQNRVYCMEEITVQNVMEIIRKNAYRLINPSGSAGRSATVSSEKPAAL